MNENKLLKHLDYIQAVIARMGSNSFLVKGWSVTIMAAIFALAAKDSNPRFAVIPLITIPMFWGLDAFFLATEWRFRDLYEEVTKKKENDKIDFSMKVGKYAKNRSLLKAARSKTLWPFHLTLILSTVAVGWVIPNWDGIWNHFFTPPMVSLIGNLFI